ncbi:hypothetical protein OS493_015702 [Desmophyllum pertusum]|uniref:Uncharacterized protein n=1 Tax=Desmophyllum pertusum TaxID=174260 RepID=A0A9X0CM84_9CNID|nr:hypothetical protein OS493_015702 [Desmophyllum pertusum]
MAVANLQENEDSPTETTEQRTPLWRKAKAVVFKNLMPICLLFFVIFGIVLPEPGVFFSELPTHYVCVVGLFFHSGLKLKTGEVKQALRSFKALFWGIVCILLITPIIGGQLTGLLPYTVTKEDHGSQNGFHVNGDNSTNRSTSSSGDHLERSSILGPPLFQTGMQIYFIVPCTISAGVILTAQAGGAVAISVMLTVFCNLAAVFTVPPLLSWIIAFENVKLDPVQLLIKLLLTVLLPLLVGKALRYVPRVKPCITKFSDTLKVISIILLTMIPWLKVSQASAQKAFSGISIGSIFAVLGWGLAIHVLYIIVILPPCFILKLEKPALKSVVIMASQKSLSVAVTISGYLPFTQAEQGLLSLPIIVIHLGIIVSDSVWASWWFSCDAKKEKAAAADRKSNINGDLITGQHCENELQPLACDDNEALHVSDDNEALHVSAV